MITIACVCVGDKYGPEYVDKLSSMVSRHTTLPFEFECIRESTLPGWWAKLDLFKKREERILYIDLDTVIVGNIDRLLTYDGPFCILKDWWAPTYNSSVMSIAPGFGQHIWSRFHPSLMQIQGSDQEWITVQVPNADLWQDVTPGLIGSYKADGLQDGPRDFSLVCFHGDPKPHTFEKGWVYESWT